MADGSWQLVPTPKVFNTGTVRCVRLRDDRAEGLIQSKEYIAQGQSQFHAQDRYNARSSLSFVNGANVFTGDGGCIENVTAKTPCNEA